MSSSEISAAAKEVWFDEKNLWLLLTDGRQLAVPLTFFPRLLHATPQQRKKYEMSGGGTGLHWEELDEDISVAGLLLGRRDQTKAARSAQPTPVKPKRPPTRNPRSKTQQ
jgi:hypothetical protein